ncbi:MAG: DUF2399 domain-containing protein [Lachnospiraceae bacterium]|nr:DUF2399 domain-containing protein [Lachnospiraceae bacterium]
MDYSKDIVNRLLEIFERRSGYAKDPTELRSIQFDIAKEYPAYTDRYDHEKYKDINLAIEKDIEAGFVFAEKNQIGQYSKIRLNIANVDKAYAFLKRSSIPEQCKKVLKELDGSDWIDNVVLRKMVEDFKGQVGQYKKLPYDLGFDAGRVREILRIIAEIMKLDSETYIRNFSTALFKDSKRFQKEFRSTVESILFDYTDDVVEKDGILGFYNLYENPTYVLIKGDARIRFERTVVDLLEMPGGIALSNASLEGIREIVVNSERVITVENLTSYHDCDEKEAVFIYLGGFHNASKQKLLEKIYASNKEHEYLHEGDLDVYGFLILENLKAKTGIPFKPFLMDLQTLERFHHAGLYKPLSARDKKVINTKKDGALSEYKDALEYMIQNDCKVEQESIKAVELIEGEY